MKINGIEMSVIKSYYNRSKVQEDGITHIIDTNTRYPLYELRMNKNYYDIEDKDEIINMIIEDLQKTVDQLKELKKEEQENENPEREE